MTHNIGLSTRPRFRLSMRRAEAFGALTIMARSWTQIKNALNPALNTDRASFSVTPIAGGLTRMYVGDGKFPHHYGEPGARVSDGRRR